MCVVCGQHAHVLWREYVCISLLLLWPMFAARLPEFRLAMASSGRWRLSSSDSVIGGVGIFEGTFNEEFRVAGVKTEIVPAIILPLLGFSTFVLMKSPNFTPRIVCCPSWFKIFLPSSAAKLFVNLIGAFAGTVTDDICLVATLYIGHDGYCCCCCCCCCDDCC